MSRFLKNAIKLGSATALAQLIGVLLIPVITRLYAPADFGINQIFISTVLIIGAVSCLSYELSILLPKTEREAAHIVVLCFFIIIFISCIVGIAFWVFADWIEDVLSAPGFSRYIILLPIGIFLHGSAVVMTLWLSRRIRFSTIAVSKVASSLSHKIVQIGFGLLSASPLGLISGSLASDAVCGATMLKGMKNDQKSFQNLSIREMRELARRYIKFPIFSSGSMLANVASVNVTSYLLAFFFGPIIVGYYAIAYTVAKLPVKLIGDAMIDVFYQKVSEEKRAKGSINKVVQQIHKRLVSIGIFPFIVLMFIGEDLFGVFLGAEWLNAGLYAKIMAPWLFFVFISSPLGTIFYVLERQGINFIFNVLLLASRIGSLCIGGFYGDPVIALVLYSVSGVVFWGWKNMYILHIAGVSVKESVIEIIRFSMIGCVIVIPLMIGKYFDFSSIILIIFAAIVTLIYYLLILYDDIRLREEFFQMIRRPYN